LQISAMIRHDAALFSFVVAADDAVTVAELKLPDEARLVIVYRGEKFILPDDTTELKTGDEAVVLCHQDVLEELQERWTAREVGSALG
ncbi:MAG: TrkA C-terminal domain-containing protein, partial [Lysobacterales bacterium]